MTGLIVKAGNMTSESLNDQGSSEPIIPAQVGEQAPEEKLVPQSVVDRVVGSAKQQAYNKGRQEALAEAQAAQTPQAPQNIGGMQQQTPDEINRLIDQRMQEQALHQQGQQVAQTFIQQMHEGSKNYPDFEQVVSGMDFERMPDIVRAAAQLGNSADIMYDLAQNGAKVPSLMMLAREQPGLFFREMQKLSASIKTNQNATQKALSAKEPLSQVRPSTIGADNGSMTVKDLREASYLSPR